MGDWNQAVSNNGEVGPTEAIQRFKLIRDINLKNIGIALMAPSGDHRTSQLVG